MSRSVGAVLVAGSANLDFVVRASHVPAPGETVLGREFATFPGGKGANQAVASARAGAVSTRMLVALGDDPQARVLEEALVDAGVAAQVVRVPDLASGTAFICLSDDAENAITVAPGANTGLRPHHLPSLRGVSHLLLQLETPLDTVATFARLARDAGVRVVLNAAPATTLPEGMLDSVDVLVVNEGELTALTGRGTVAAQIARLAVPCVVVTLGERGCVARRGAELFLQPAFPVDAVDTTAAGDTFCGALTARLSEHAGLADALRFASAASALACTRLGAQASIPARTDVDAWLATQVDDPARRAALAVYCGTP
ncbi:ribokinase [Pseudoxanthomonas japonensis]|uniref:ribokinase n=1 Tax=Pseudoxanthomonas japonensis TaxID=69284 RepID=UPI002866EC5B|nr:ribokinase [Pseudoxanthomonas japonensis]MDR7069897.1 ribokinase [Pseudoxanthomonas japonensis]